MLKTEQGSQRVLLRDQKNSRKQGDVGLAIAIAWFVEHGHNVSIPLTDSQDYDLVVEFEGRLCGIQVRTTYHRKENGSYQANLRVLGGNRSGTGKVKQFDPELVDFLFIVTEDGQKYLIPSGAIHNRSSIALCNKYAEFRVE